MKTEKQPTFMEIVGALLGAYVFPFVICAVLILIKFNTEDWAIALWRLLAKLSDAEYFIHAASDAGISMSVVVCFLSGLLLIFAANLFYFRPYRGKKYSNRKYFAFLALSLLTLSISIPPNSPPFVPQNSVMAGYFFIALFFAHQIIKSYFFTKNALEGYISKSTSNIIVLLMLIFAGVITFACLSYGNNTQNWLGLSAIFISIFLGLERQRCYAKTPQGEAEKRDIKKTAYYYFLKKHIEMRKKGAKNIPKETRDNIVLFAREFEKKIVKIPLGNQTLINISIKTISENLAGINIKEDGNKISIELASQSQEIKVNKNFFVFRYPLPISLIAEKINGHEKLAPNHFWAAFSHMKRFDLPRNELLDDVTREAKEYGNYVGTSLIPDILNNPNYSGKEEYVPVKIYYSLEYSLPLSELSEHCSNYFADNPKPDMTTEEQFPEAWRYAIKKSLGKIAPQDSQISGYALAELAVNMNSYDDLKKAVEIHLIDVDEQRKTTEYTLLHYSAIEGYSEITKYLLDNKANPNIPNLGEQYPLHFAACFNKAEIVKLLLDYGAEKNAKDDSGNTPLMYAIRENHPETTKILLDYGADFNEKDKKGVPTMEIARKINPKLAKLIAQYSKK